MRVVGGSRARRGQGSFGEHRSRRGCDRRPREPAADPASFRTGRRQAVLLLGKIADRLGERLRVGERHEPPVGFQYSGWASGGGSFVMVEEAAEAIVPFDWADRDLWWRVGRLEPEAAVRALGVVVLEIVANDTGEMAPVPEQGPVEALAADRADEAFAAGARTGVRITRIASDAKTVSKVLVYFASRSRIRNENRSSSPAMARFRPCWATQDPCGLRVTPATWTRRVASSMKNSTSTRRRRIVSTQKKSQASIPSAWARINSRQVGPSRRGAGFNPAARRTRRTLAGETLIASLRTSPVIRW